MRVLIIDADAKAKAERVMAYARQHIYYPGEPPPGDDPRHVCLLNDFCCTFSYTKDEASGKLYRHLSVSIPVPDRYPSPEAMAEIAALFEFSGAEQGVEARIKAGRWIWHVQHEEPHCFILAEELRDD